MIGPEQLAAGQRAETAGDFIAAAAAYRAVTEVSDERIAAEAYFCLARVSWRQSRFDVALVSFESARALAERLADEELLARVENGIGAVHYASGDYSAARRAYGAAQLRTSDVSMRGKILLNLGVIANIEGDFATARQHYDEAITMFVESGDRGSAMLAFHNRGMVEADLKLWERADTSFRAALDIAGDRGEREMVARTLVNRSEVLVEWGELAEAVAHCDRALSIYADVGDEVGRGEALRWRAHSLGRMGEFQEADRDATESMRIAIRCGARLLEAEAAREVGVIRSQLGDRTGGGKHLRRALALFTELGARRDASEVSAVLQQPTPARSFKAVGPKRSRKAE